MSTVSDYEFRVDLDDTDDFSSASSTQNSLINETPTKKQRLGEKCAFDITADFEDEFIQNMGSSFNFDNSVLQLPVQPASTTHSYIPPTQEDLNEYTKALRDTRI